MVAGGKKMNCLDPFMKVDRPKQQTTTIKNRCRQLTHVYFMQKFSNKFCTLRVSRKMDDKKSRTRSTLFTDS